MHPLRENLLDSHSFSNRLLTVVLQDDLLAHNGMSKTRYQVYYCPAISSSSICRNPVLR